MRSFCFEKKKNVKIATLQFIDIFWKIFGAVFLEKKAILSEVLKDSWKNRIVLTTNP